MADRRKREKELLQKRALTTNKQSDAAIKLPAWLQWALIALTTLSTIAPLLAQLRKSIEERMGVDPIKITLLDLYIADSHTLTLVSDEGANDPYIALRVRITNTSDKPLQIVDYYLRAISATGQVNLTPIRAQNARQLIVNAPLARPMIIDLNRLSFEDDIQLNVLAKSVSTEGFAFFSRLEHVNKLSDIEFGVRTSGERPVSARRSLGTNSLNLLR
jgi:hypothetical protein